MMRRLIPVLLIIVVGVVSYMILKNPPDVKRSASQCLASLSIDVIS